MRSGPRVRSAGVGCRGPLRGGGDMCARSLPFRNGAVDWLARCADACLLRFLVAQLISFVVDQRLITAHVGDSRAVMHDGSKGACATGLVCLSCGRGACACERTIAPSDAGNRLAEPALGCYCPVPALDRGRRAGMWDPDPRCARHGPPSRAPNAALQGNAPQSCTHVQRSCCHGTTSRTARTRRSGSRAAAAAWCGRARGAWVECWRCRGRLATG